MAEAISRAKLGMNVGDAERIGSTIAGLVLISRAVAKPTLGRIVLAVAGAALLHRGVTGRCSLYKALRRMDGFDSLNSSSPGLARGSTWMAGTSPAMTT